MENEIILCRRCNRPIPEARLRVMPNTLVCVQCSEDIGGEDEVEVTISSTGKAGSLKKTGQDVQVRVKRKTYK